MLYYHQHCFAVFSAARPHIQRTRIYFKIDYFLMSYGYRPGGVISHRFKQKWKMHLYKRNNVER